MLSSTSNGTYATPRPRQQGTDARQGEFHDVTAPAGEENGLTGLPSVSSWRRFTDLGLLILGRLSVVLAALVSVRLMTTVLSTAQVGRYSVITTFSLWFTLTLVSPAGNYIQRRFISWVSSGKLWRELSRYTGLLLLIACITAIASLIAHALGLLGISISSGELILYTVGYLVFLTINSMIAICLNLLGRRGLYVAYSSATAWLGMGCSAMLTLYLHRSAELWIAGQIVGWALISVVSYLSLRRAVATTQVHAEVDTEHQGLWAFVGPLIFSTSLYWFQVQGYRLELEHWVGVSAVGLLTTGLLLGANPVTIVDTLLGEYLRPEYYRAIANSTREAQEEAWSKMAGTFVTWLIPIVVLVGFSGSFLAAILVGPSFKSVAALIGWGVLIEFVRAVNSLYLVAAHTRFQTRTTVRPAIVGAGIILFAIVPLAQWNLFVGSSIALVLGMVGSTAYLAVRLRAVFRARLPLRYVLHGAAYSLPVGLILIGAQHLIQHPSIVQALAVLTLAGIMTLVVQICLVYGPFATGARTAERLA